jgi:hypothetical protein
MWTLRSQQAVNPVIKAKLMFRKFNRCSLLLAAAAMLFGFGESVVAQRIPPTCASSGASLALSIYAADGKTDLTGKSVSACEKVIYVATLSPFPKTGCDIKGGKLMLITPDGVPHDVTPGSIPQLTQGQSVDSVSFPYTVKEFGSIVASITWTEGSIFNGDPLGTGAAGPFPITNPVVSCDDGNPCTEDSCDPIRPIIGPLGDPTVFRLGACVNTPKDCSDENPCTEDRCNPTTGACVYVEKSCADKNPCTIDSCDLATGKCIHTAKNCDDGNACTIDQCSVRTGNCVYTAVVCNDSNACTIDWCDATGCKADAITCDDDNLCTTDSCDPLTGCKYVAVDCDDGNACTIDSCNPALGCQHSDISCDDKNPCTVDTCDTTLGCQHQGEAAGIEVSCELLLSSSFDLDGVEDGHVTLPIGSQNAPVALEITITNPNDFPVQVISIQGLPVLVDCGVTPDQLPVIVAPDVPKTVYLGCVPASCPGGTLTLTAVATPLEMTALLCSAQSTCSGSVTCVDTISCRVTGGGELTPEDPETLLDGQSCSGAEVLKVTHGGQMGAPFSTPSCGDVGNNPFGQLCIRGQWQHVRHFGGKNKAQSSVVVDTLHTKTPTGVFDSLKCACLPCLEEAQSGGVAIVGGLCNPDDRVCGPEPRHAPGNAIIFSGVGYMTSCATANGRGRAGAQPVLFRVYVEDRSEPGGSFPGGANGPADIYCFQAWAINGDYTKDVGIVAMRQALANDNCAFLQGYVPGDLPNPELFGKALINDCGPLRTGNHQIHPSTGSTCP